LDDQARRHDGKDILMLLKKPGTITKSMETINTDCFQTIPQPTTS